MGITAAARASLHLEGTTSLDTTTIVSLLQETSGTVKGGGKSLLTSGLWNIGAHINVVSATDSKVQFTLTSGKDLIELCTFSANLSRDESARTTIRVGGLETYKTTQSKMYGVIPSGPKMIGGMDPYKRFLAAVQQEIESRDPSARLSQVQDEKYV